MPGTRNVRINLEIDFPHIAAIDPVLR